MKRTAVATYAGLLVAFGLVLPPTPGRAGQMTLSDLRDLCSGTDSGRQDTCGFYILGAFEGLSLGGGTKEQNGKFVEKSSGKHFCVPDDLPAPVMREKVMKLAENDLKAYPADATTSAISFVAAAITLTYPCP